MPNEGILYIGIDGSGYGKDKTVITFRIGLDYFQLVYDKIEGFEARNKIMAELKKHPKWIVGGIAIDQAYGQTYYENLYQEFEIVELLNFASKPKDEQYANLRAEIYFGLIEAIRQGLPLTDEIEKELNSTLFEFNNSGKLKLIPKEEIKMVLGHSPDRTDSLALTYALPQKQYSTLTDSDYELGDAND